MCNAKKAGNHIPGLFMLGSFVYSKIVICSLLLLIPTSVPQLQYLRRPNVLQARR